MTRSYSQERWLLNSPPRHNPSPPIHSHRYSIAESTRSTYNSTLAFDRFKDLNSCTFRVPASDNGIRADTHKGLLQCPLPDERDDYTIVRRYLYNILTRAGFGISEKYPAAVRCTVEAWYGDGGFFRAKCEHEDGLRGLCPEDGKDHRGVEFWFHEMIREKIDECVRSEIRKSLQRGKELADAASAAASYTSDATHEEQDIRASDDAVTNDKPPQDQRSLYSNDCSVYSREENEAKPSNPPGRHDSARSSTANHSASTSEKLASSYMDFIRSSIEAEHPLEASPSLTTDEYQPKEPSLHESLPITPDEETQELVGKTCTKVATTTAIASKRSFIKRITSVKDFAVKPTSSSNENATPKNVPDRRPGGYKKARVGYTPTTESKLRVSRDIIRTMDGLMQGKESTQPQMAPIKKQKKSFGDATVSPKIAAYSKTPEMARNEEVVVVAAATVTAQRARHLKLDEARRLNHHAERKKAGFFAKVFGRMGGKRKERYCADINAYTGS